MVSLYRNICNGWSSWNCWLERETTHVAQHLSRVLPHSILPIVQTNRLTQMQLLVHSLGLGVLLGLSIANPIIPTPVALSIMGIGMIVTAKPLFRYLSSYIREITHLPLRKKVVAIAIPLFLGTIGISSGLLGKSILFSHGLRGNCFVLLEGCMGLSCVNSIANALCCCNCGSSSYEEERPLYNEDGVIEVRRNRAEEERYREEVKIQELRDEVKKLRTMKMKLEAYVAARPKLQEECSKALKKDPKVIDTATPVSLDGIDEEGRLMIEKNNLRYDLEVRMNFIMAYKNVYDSFKEHLEQEGLQELEWSNYGK